MTYDDLHFDGEPDPLEPITSSMCIAVDVVLHVDGIVTAVETLDVREESVADLMRCISALSGARERLSYALSSLLARTETATLR